jgi:hypothetical protein
MQLRSLAVAASLATGLVAPAAADPVTLNVHWSGAVFGNSATATGFITFDDAVLPSIGFPSSTTPLPDPAVIDFGITVSGAAAGNGSFDLGDFDSLYFYTPVALDLGRELIGQPVGGSFTFGPAASVEPGAGDGDSGEFNVFSTDPNAPSGFWFFKLATLGGRGDALAVTSMVPVPEPATAALLLAGLGLLAGLRRKTGG